MNTMIMIFINSETGEEGRLVRPRDRPPRCAEMFMRQKKGMPLTHANVEPRYSCH